VPKVYEIGCKHPVTDDQVQQLLRGVTLIDDPVPVRAAAAEATGVFDGPQAVGLGELHGLRMTLTEGKYHQVKRMVAAVGNRVEALHRSRYGALALPDDLAPGQWRWLSGPHDVTPAVQADA
jgi:16S rRNA pseudouridine516 synthase